MPIHWKGISLLLVVLALGFAGAVAAESLYLAIVVLIGGLVLAFVMTTAWMRPPGSSVEHHAPSDRLVDDTRP